MNEQIIVINSVTASGADCTVGADGTVNLAGLVKQLDGTTGVSGAIQFKNNWVSEFAVIPYTATTPSVWTSSTTATASTSYQIRIEGVSKVTGQWTSWDSPIITSASSTSKSAINTYFNSWVNSMTGQIPATSDLSGSNPNKEFVITADTNYPIIVVTNIGTGLTGVSETTPGVMGHGNGAIEKAVGQYPSNDLSDSGTYTTVQIKFVSNTWTGALNSTGQWDLILYVNQADADYPTLVGYSSTLGIGYGTLTSVLYNNRKANYSAVGASVAVASNVATRASGSFFTENIKSGDMFLINTGSSATPALITFPYWDGVTVANLIVDKALVSGSDVSSAAASLIKYTSLPA